MSEYRYFKPGTLEEFYPTSIMQLSPTTHTVEVLPDGTFKCGRYVGATPEAAIHAFKSALASAYAQVEAEWADKKPIAHCHYCGQGIYNERDSFVNMFGVDQCQECR